MDGGGGGGGGGGGPLVLVEGVLEGAGGFGGVGGGALWRYIGPALIGRAWGVTGVSSHTVLSPLLAEIDPMLLQRRGGALDPQEEPTPLLLLLWAGEAGGDTWKGLWWAESVVVFLRGGGGGGGDLMSTRVVWRPLEMEDVGLGGAWKPGGRDCPKQLITRGDSGALWVLSTPRRFSSWQGQGPAGPTQ